MKKAVLSIAMFAAFSGAAVAAPIVASPSTLTYTGSNPFQLGSWGVGDLSNTGSTFTFTVDGYNSVDLSISSSPQSGSISAQLYLGNGTSNLLGTAVTGTNYTYITSSYLTNQIFTVKYIGNVDVNSNGNVSVRRVPAPAVLGLAGIGLVGLGFFSRRRAV